MTDGLSLIGSSSTSSRRSRGPKAAASDPATEGKLQPFSAGGSTGTPVLTLAVHLQGGQSVYLPWASFVQMQRIEDQIALQIGKWVVKIQIDADKMQKAGWQLFSLIDALQDQTARSLQSAPDIGISVQAEELEDEE